MNNIPTNERLMIALDVPDVYKSCELIDELVQADVQVFKIGLELLTSNQYFDAIKILHLHKRKIFADVKLYDIPATVSKSIRGLTLHGVDFITVHGNSEIIKAAVDAKDSNTKILAVTILTSMDQNDLSDFGIKETLLIDMVLAKAEASLIAGADGIVCSGFETARLRAEFGDEFIIVNPGIRSQTDLTNDQKRVVTVQDALLNGADYLVVGRPIRDAENVAQAVTSFQTEIRSVLECMKR